MANEVEIKFVVHDLDGIRARLREMGFEEETPRTHEMNTLFDRLGRLRSRGEVLRIRKYGDQWLLTHKAKAKDSRHKTRVETETGLDNGEKLAKIFESIGYSPRFTYEKFRSEWSDGHGHVVLDETPIGNFGEIEGTPEWIDATADKLGIVHKDYITKSYAELFFDWTRKMGSKAKNMTFDEVNAGR